MDVLNEYIIQEMFKDIYSPKTKEDFASKYNIRIEDIPGFKFPENNSQLLRKELNDIIDRFF